MDVFPPPVIYWLGVKTRLPPRPRVVWSDVSDIALSAFWIRKRNVSSVNQRVRYELSFLFFSFNFLFRLNTRGFKDVFFCPLWMSQIRLKNVIFVRICDNSELTWRKKWLKWDLCTPLPPELSGACGISVGIWNHNSNHCSLDWVHIQYHTGGARE